jgi:prepilin-type N-terminal cleavage/methylation domain-containing protein/prepilin-type processing-associated H-X9-DG protein
MNTMTSVASRQNSDRESPVRFRGPLPGCRRSGFTLIELLAVIAIIAVLVALLVPALAGAKERGKKTRCIGNLRQLGMAVQQYSSDHGERLPGSAIAVPASAGASGGWMWYAAVTYQMTDYDPGKGSIYSYVGGRGLYLCPSDRSGQASSYSLNGLLAPEPEVGGICPGIAEAAIRSPSSTLLFAEAADNCSGGSDDGWLRVGAGANPISTRHSGGSEFVFYDGHVEFLIPSRLQYPNPDGPVRFEP